MKSSGFDAFKKEFADEPATAQKLSDLTEMLAPSTVQAAAAQASGAFPVGDSVVLEGLQRARELNGQSAIVVAPTDEEGAQLQATGRLVVAVADSGDRIAVRSSNLRLATQSPFRD